MSPRWLEPPLTALATPADVRLVRGGRLLHMQACAPGALELAVPAALVAALRAAAPPATGRSRWRPRVRLRLLLSHHLAPLALLPQARQLQGEEERQAAARHRFAAIHGTASAADWQLLVDPPRGRSQAALAAALDVPLLEGLRRAVATVGMALASVEPLICAAAAAAGSKPEGAGWLVVPEPGRVVLARHVRGGWVSLRTHRPRAGLAVELPGWVAQARLLDGLEDAGGEHIVVAGLQREALEDMSLPAGWSLEQRPLVEPRS